MREYTPEPRLYEMMTILSPDVPEDDLPAHIETIAGYVTTAGGTVNETLRDSPWGRRRLAYSIRHAGRDIRDGFYTVFHFTLDPNGVRDIERDLKLNDQVMRFLITHYTPKPEVPGAAPEAGEETSADAEAAPATEAAAAEPAAPAEAAAVTETPAEQAAAPEVQAESPADAEAAQETFAAEEAAETAATEPAEEVAESAATGETSDTEAASITAEPEEIESAPPPVADAVSEETTAPPTAPKEGDEEA